MGQRSKILSISVVATMMGTATPLRAESSEDMYGYLHRDANGQIVGRARDNCTPNGINGIQWLSGYGTNDVEVILIGVCTDGFFDPY